MLRSLNDLKRYKVNATDGEVGSTADFLLDDRRWVIRYLVVETAGLLGGPRVLVSPISVREANCLTRRFHVALTSDMVNNSPAVDADHLVSRQDGRDHAGYKDSPLLRDDEATGDVHLRGAGEVHGYHVQGTDDSIGHLEDFIVDDESWAVRYLVIDTRNWWFGKRVLVAPQWATRVSWAERTVYLDKTREVIKHSPEWTGMDALNREYEGRLHAYYAQPAYWEHDTRSEPAHPAHRSANHHA